MCDGLKMPISISFIDKAIKELKTNKSSGPDLLLNEEFFIHSKNTLLSYLCTLFKKFLIVVISLSHGLKALLYLYTRKVALMT